jgi:hypothetical protein
MGNKKTSRKAARAKAAIPWTCSTERDARRRAGATATREDNQSNYPPLKATFPVCWFPHVRLEKLRSAESMDFHGFPWISMDFHGFPWISMDFMDFMDFHGFSWIFMDFHGFPWISMDFHGFSWIFMDFRGFPWMELRGSP